MQLERLVRLDRRVHWEWLGSLALPDLRGHRGFQALLGRLVQTVTTDSQDRLAHLDILVQLDNLVHLDQSDL